MNKLIFFAHLLALMTASLGMVIVDEDPTAVSWSEWALFAVVLYTAITLVKTAAQAAMKEYKKDYE